MMHAAVVILVQHQRVHKNSIDIQNAKNRSMHVNAHCYNIRQINFGRRPMHF